MSKQKLFTIFVLVSLILLAAFTLRAGLEASAVSRSQGARLIQMNQTDDLGQPGVHLQVYPHLGNDEPNATPLRSNNRLRK